jgi:hypothetical protein
MHQNKTMQIQDTNNMQHGMQCNMQQYMQHSMQHKRSATLDAKCANYLCSWGLMWMFPPALKKNSELCFQNGDLIRFFEIGGNSSENGKHSSEI